MKKTKNYLLAGLLLLIAVVSVGYAALNTKLNITGTATAKGNTWSIVLENVRNVTSGKTAPTISGTKVEYTVTLEKPKDVYEFDVDITNKGSVAAKLSAAPIITASTTYLSHEVTYADGTAIQANDTLAANQTKTVHVKVTYKDTVVPAADQETALSAQFDYIQG